jgi:YcxB-like protein
MSRESTESLASGISYTLSFADFLATRRALAWNGVFGPATYWIRFAILGTIVSICWALLIRLKPYAVPGWHMIALVLVGAAAMTIVGWALDLMVARFAFGRLALANAKISLKFEVDGVHYDTPSYSGILLWSGIRRVMTPPGYLLLFISKSEALVLPRRAFASDSAFGDTISYLQTRPGVGEAR